MKTTKIICWSLTSVISLLMVLSAYNYITNPALKEGFIHLGFPDYFRVELGLAKLLGAVMLLIPGLPLRVKEWTYAGFGITFISAGIAHIAIGDTSAMAIMPFVFFALLAASYVYFNKVRGIPAVS